MFKEGVHSIRIFFLRSVPISRMSFNTFLGKCINGIFSVRSTNHHVSKLLCLSIRQNRMSTRGITPTIRGFVSHYGTLPDKWEYRDSHYVIVLNLWVKINAMFASEPSRISAFYTVFAPVLKRITNERNIGCGVAFYYFFPHIIFIRVPIRIKCSIY